MTSSVPGANSDFPLAPGFDALVGYGLSNSLPATLAVKASLLAVGVWLYVGSTRALDHTGRFALVGLVAFLVLVYLGNLFGPPPSAVREVAWLGHAQWLLVLWAYWVDAHRQALAPPQPLPAQPLPANGGNS